MLPDPRLMLPCEHLTDFARLRSDLSRILGEGSLARFRHLLRMDALVARCGRFRHLLRNWLSHNERRGFAPCSYWPSTSALSRLVFCHLSRLLISGLLSCRAVSQDCPLPVTEKDGRNFS
ncbi:hypothetical protein SAMN04515647_4419 [Cohaesibacter sp. ES.047]|uniref:hypothetical protein n=1 Tax=Cohaesibacter sp. ES.047 TaxID=1798205 RepID=UPI000BB7A693|nr:hypothetical protein [Cohaesibacter sp. ES.047]SNY94096.1 hypothetical protein SAMN04515647_4419 [Cohaesibacter sp. ES.047]